MYPDAGSGPAAGPDGGGIAGERPTVRDRRRVDPTTGAVRPDAAGPARSDAGRGAHAGAASDEPAAGGASDGDAAADAEAAELRAQVAELTGDLQRVQAEYANYRRRIDRERGTLGETAVGTALTELLPVLDDIGRARDHGELVGGFKSVADRLDGALTKLGLVAFGAPGDPFDPVRHEALVHSYSDGVTDTTCTEVFALGYQLGDRILRAAKVAVADPTTSLPVDGGAGSSDESGRGVPEPDQNGPDQRGPDERGPDESGPNESGPNESGPNESGPDQSGPDQRGHDAPSAG